jgi:Lrp/AsnC family transcriptional regulator for asnA, asnC and gidA
VRLPLGVESDVDASVVAEAERLVRGNRRLLELGFDLLVEVVCEDDEHLLEVINKRIRAVPGVVHTETFVYLRLRKQIYTWGTR